MHGADYYVSCMSRRTVAAKAVLVDDWKCRPEAGINLYGTPRPMDAAGAAKGVRFVTLCRRQNAGPRALPDFAMQAGGPGTAPDQRAWAK